MQAKLLAWFMAFAGALGKQVTIAATPVVLGLAKELGGTIFDLGYDELDPELSARDKHETEQFALATGRTMWDVCKEEGLLLASDSAALLEQAAASEIQSALGIE